MKSGKFKGSLGFAHRRFCDFAFSYSETHTRISTHVLETKVPRSVSGNLPVFAKCSGSVDDGDDADYDDNDDSRLLGMPR